MKKISKLSHLFIAIMFLLFAFAGCFGRGGPIEDPTLDPNDNSPYTGNITIWWPGGSDAEKIALETAKQQYIAANPEVTIDIVARPTAQFYDSYVSALQGSNFPDICYLDHVYVQQLAFEDMIVNLSKLDPQIDTVIKEKIIDSLWGASTYNGDAYGLPVSANTMALVYNKAILKRAYTAAGRTWTEADVPTTWDEFLAACAIVKEHGGSGVMPYTFPSGSGSNNSSMSALQFLSYAAREGGSLMSQDLKTMTMNSAQVKQAAEKIYSLRANGGLGYSNASFDEGGFESGRIAFIEMGPWKMNTYKLLSEATPNVTDFGWAPIVKFSDSGSTASPLGLFSMVLTKKSNNIRTAEHFMKFFTTNSEVMLQHNAPQYLISPLKANLSAAEYTGDIWQVYLEQIDNVVARPGTPIWPVLEQNICEFATALLNNTRQPSYLDDINYSMQFSLNEVFDR